MILSRRYVWLLLLFLGAAARVQTQDLKQEWTRIQAEFLSGMHDSVVIHIRPFIAELEKQNLKPQLSVALFHYGVSLAQIGSLIESDSAFTKAKAVAYDAGLREKVGEIEQKQARHAITPGRCRSLAVKET